MDTEKKSPEEIAAEKIFPGAAIDAADDDKVKQEEISERTAVLDDNPHTIGI